MSNIFVLTWNDQQIASIVQPRRTDTCASVCTFVAGVCVVVDKFCDVGKLLGPFSSSRLFVISGGFALKRNEMISTFGAFDVVIVHWLRKESARETLHKSALYEHQSKAFATKHRTRTASELNIWSPLTQHRGETRISAGILLCFCTRRTLRSVAGKEMTGLERCSTSYSTSVRLYLYKNSKKRKESYLGIRGARHCVFTLST